MIKVNNFTDWRHQAGIYGIQNNTTTEWYVGQASSNGRRSICVRFREHIRDLRRGKDTRHLQNSWNKYGKETFSFFVLEVTENNQDVLNEKEKYWMVTLKSVSNGYNISTDPRCPAVPYTEERRQKLGQASRERWLDPQYKEKMSILAKERMSKPEYKAIAGETLKKLWSNSEMKAKMIEQAGRERSTETCRKISEAKQGKPCYGRRGLKQSDETKAKISKAKKGKPSTFKGKKHSDTSRANMSAARIGNTNCVGRVLSEETKAKIAAGRVGKWWTEEQMLKKRMLPPPVGKYKGVSYNKSAQKYKAAMTHDRKELFFGWFDNPVEAATNYDYHALQLYGNGQCFINFPDKDYTNFTSKRVVSW